MTDAQEGGDVEIKVDSLELPAPNVEMSIGNARCHAIDV